MPNLYFYFHKYLLHNYLLLATVLCSLFVMGDIQAQVSIQFPKRDVNPGDTVCLEARVSDFTNIQRMEFQIAWDSTVMDLHSILPSKNLPELTSDIANFFPVSDGTLNVKWNYSNIIDGFTIENDSVVIFTLCFKVQPGTYGLSAALNINANPASRIVVRPTEGRLNYLQLNYTHRGRVSVNVPPYAPLSINIADTAATVGKRSCVDVTTKDFKAITKLHFGVGWDETKVKLDTIQDFGFVSLNKQHFKTTLNTLIVDWKSIGGISVADGKTLFKMCFSPLINQNDTILLRFLPDPASVINIYSNPTGKQVDLLQKEGSIVITKINIVAPPLVLSLPQKTAKVGNSICLEMTVGAFKNITAVKDTLQWNAAQLTFQSIESIVPNVNFTFDAAKANQGILPFSLTSKTTSGATLNDSTILARICFKVIGTGNTTAIVNFSTKNSATNNLQKIDITTQSGSVIIPAIVAASPLVLALQQKKANVGDEVCLNMTVAGFNDITTANATLEWNIADLKFNALEIIEQSITIDFNIGNVKTGALPFTLTSKNAKGATLADDVVLANLCYTVVGGSGTDSSIGFNKDAVANNTTQKLAVTTKSGGIQVAALAAVKPEFALRDTTTTNGAIVCMNVAVVNMLEIKDFAYTLTWDTAVVRFKNIANFGLANLSNANFDLSQTTKGALPLKWSNGTKGMTISTRKTLFTLCFEVIGASGKSSVIKITPNSTAINVNEPTNNLGVLLPDATIRIQQVITVTNSIITNSGCTTGGSIKITPTGGKLPYTYLWQEGTKTSTIQNLQKGTYKVTVTDANNSKEVFSFMVDNNVEKPIAAAFTSVLIDCKTKQAKLNALASSQAAQYAYTWTTTNGKFVSGVNTLQPIVGSAGTYILQVRNTTNSCTDTISVFVRNQIIKANILLTDNQQITCKNNKVQMDATSSIGDVLTYEWMVGGKVIGTLPKAIANIGGNYTLKVRNALGCEDISIVQVSADTIRPKVAATTQSNLNCRDIIAPLDGTGTATGKEYSYKWYTANGKFVDSTNQITAKAMQEGNYSLQVINNRNGCTAESSTKVTIDTLKPLIVMISPTVLTCRDSIIEFDANASSKGSQYITEWTTEDGQYLTKPTALTAKATKVGNYTLNITNTKNFCTTSRSTTITENKIFPKATAVAVGMINCRDSIASINGSESSIGVMWQNEWTTKDGKIKSGNTQLIANVTKAGHYTLKVSDPTTGCAAATTVNIFSDTISPKIIIKRPNALSCANNQVLLDATQTGAVPFTFDWQTKDGNFLSGMQNAKATVDKIATYTLKVTDTENFCTAKASVEVNGDFEKPFADAGLPLEIPCDKDFINLDGASSSTGADIRYRWETKNGKIASGKNTSLLTITQEGEYVLIVENIRNGCTDIDTVLVSPEAELQPAYAGIDRTVCSDTAQVQAILLNNNVKGTWSVINKNTVLDNPNEASTIVSHLEGGENKFIWTVSKGRCKAYSKDTLVLRRIIQPLVTADVFDLKPSVSAIIGDVLNNDLFFDDMDANKDLQFKWLRLPTEGQFTAGEANGKFQYTLPLGLLKDVDWLYSICHPACIATCDSVKVTINNQNTKIIAANTITPNGDGANDTFIVDELLTNPAAYPNNEIVILNRWGEVVFEAKPYNNDWDGANKYRQPLPQGTYYYILRLDNNRGIILKGDITVLR